MAWSVKARLKEITDLEKGLAPKDPGGRIMIALVWPGSYRTGMSALGFLSIYGMLNARPEVAAERFFWPDGALAREYERTNSPLLSLESGRPLTDFDLVAASLSLENDYWLLPAILDRGGLAIRSGDRRESDPPVLAGGVAVWANPWPLWSFADLILTGEAEAQWPQLLSAWSAIRLAPLPKAGKLRLLGRNTPGTLHPGEVTEPPASPGEGLRDLWLSPAAAPPESGAAAGNQLLPVRPAFLAWPPEGWRPPVSPLLTPQTEFADAKLVEISRGCPYGCRFCLAGFIFRPHRPWPLDSILQALGPAENVGEKVGLVSPAAADHPDLAELLDLLFQQGRAVTLSSLRLSAVTEQLAAQLAGGRLQGAAVAPEGGSQPLRDRLNKLLDEKTILEGARRLAEAGLRRLKLYFMVGLPGETEEDLAALAELVARIREAARRGAAGPELAVSLANFTPKAQTPFEEAPMLTEREFKRRGRRLAQALKKIPRVSVNLDPPLWSIVQGLLARGGPESAALVEALYRNRGRLKASLADIGYTPDHPLHRPWPEGRPKPWRIVAPASGFACLERERDRAALGLTTPPCPPAGNCGRCLACGLT